MELEDYKGVKVRKGAYNRFDKGIVDEVRLCYYHADPAQASVIVDIGAHIGAYTYWCKTQNPAALIMAVEANAANAALLRLNTSQFDGVTAYYARCGYAELGDPVMVAHDTNSGGCWVCERAAAEAFVSAPAGGGYHIEEVPPLLSLEAVVAGIPKIDILKLDCEGAEFDILQHAERDTLKRIEWIVGEWHQSEAVFHDLIVTPLADLFDVVSAVPVPGENLGHFALKRKAAPREVELKSMENYGLLTRRKARELKEKEAQVLADAS